MIKVVVFVEGGVCTAVWSTERDIQVELIDVDNQKADGMTEEQRAQVFANKTEGMHYCAL